MYVYIFYLFTCMLVYICLCEYVHVCAHACLRMCRLCECCKHIYVDMCMWIWDHVFAATCVCKSVSIISMIKTLFCHFPLIMALSVKMIWLYTEYACPRVIFKSLFYSLLCVWCMFIYMHISVQVHACLCTPIWIYLLVDVCTHEYVCVCICLSECVCSWSCLYVHMSMYICI